MKKEIEMIITSMSKDLLKAKFLFFIILAEKKLNEQNNSLLNNEVKMSNRGVEKISDILVWNIFWNRNNENIFEMIINVSTYSSKNIISIEELLEYQYHIKNAIALIRNSEIWSIWVKYDETVKIANDNINKQ